jgi:hypothetical protein
LLINTYLIPESLVDLWRPYTRILNITMQRFFSLFQKEANAIQKEKKTAKIREKNN